MNNTERSTVIAGFVDNIRTLKTLCGICRKDGSCDKETLALLDDFEAYVNTFGDSDSEIHEYLSNATNEMFQVFVDRILHVQHKLMDLLNSGNSSWSAH